MFSQKQWLRADCEHVRFAVRDQADPSCSIEEARGLGHAQPEFSKGHLESGTP